jgi:hypothetical protein
MSEFPIKWFSINCSNSANSVSAKFAEFKQPRSATLQRALSARSDTRGIALARILERVSAHSTTVKKNRL